MVDRHITTAEFMLLAALIKELSGIDLGSDKHYLLETRLGPMLPGLGCESYAALYRKAKDDKTDKVRSALLNAVTTNETSFFRDLKPFELIKSKLVPDILGEDPKKPVKLWSAASSTGQEAYSVAMALAEILFDLSESGVSILGTDISEAAVNTANKGEYSAFEVGRGLDGVKLNKWFIEKGGRFQVKPELRSVVRFTRGNLLDPGTLGPFDIIMCRNVAIYFAPEDRKRIFENIASRLKSGGALIIGSTETLLGISDRFRRCEWHGTHYYTLA